jgi:hypothetical protein
MKIHSALVFCLIGTCLIVFTSCKHDNTDIVGPSICGITEKFSINTALNVNSSTPDLSSTPLLFSASFNENARWKIVVKGTQSGAIKEISGVGKTISENWDGNSDNVYFFRKELCKTTLYITCKDPIQGPQFTLTGTKVYGGVLVSNFDGSGLVSTWSTSSQGTLNKASIDSVITPPQGKYYYTMQGVDDDADYGVGLLMHNGVTYNLSTNPDSVFLNVYLYGIPNTRVDLRVLELDGDQYTYVQSVTWSGWKLISVPYSSFDLSSGTGVNGKNPNLCNRVRFLLKSSPPGATVECSLDYIVFTQGKPFDN